MQLHQILAEIAGCLPARRGKLFKQYYARADASGAVRQMGPYYVLTRSVMGKTVSERVRPTDVPRVQAEIARGEALSALVERIWELAESAAKQPGDPKKTSSGQIEEALVELVAAAAKAEVDAKSAARDLGELEGDLRTAALGFAAKVLGALLSGPLQRAAGVDTPTGRRGTRTTTILTSVGDVPYTRAHVPGCGSGPRFPADEALGLVCRCTPAAAQLLCHEAARSQSYLQASANLALAAGIAASPSTIHRLVRTVGPDMEEWALSRTPARAEPRRDIIVCLQMDMTGVRMLQKYLDGVKGKDGAPKGRQIKCGTLFLMERDGEGKYRKIGGSAVHVISFCDPVSFSAALEKARQKLATPHGTRLIVVSDGAEWIWNIVGDRFKEAFGIVDFWHAADHLHDLCEFALGKGEAAEGLFREWRRKMKVYGADCVIRHFEGMEGSAEKIQGIEKRLSYFRDHRHRMQYRRFRREGWPIGSGVIEGACKSLIKQRTDLSGQRWSPDGALDVLWVRALILDGLHDEYWKSSRNRKGVHRKPTLAA